MIAWDPSDGVVSFSPTRLRIRFSLRSLGYPSSHCTANSSEVEVEVGDIRRETGGGDGGVAGAVLCLLKYPSECLGD